MKLLSDLGVVELSCCSTRMRAIIFFSIVDSPEGASSCFMCGLKSMIIFMSGCK